MGRRLAAELRSGTATSADFWSFTQYLFYTLNDKWKAGLRYDMFVDDQGTRLGGLRFGGLPGGNPLPLPSGDAGTVQAITAGLNYTYNANIRIRPELRWDWYAGSGPELFDDERRTASSPRPSMRSSSSKHRRVRSHHRRDEAQLSHDINTTFTCQPQHTTQDPRAERSYLQTNAQPSFGLPAVHRCRQPC